MIFSTSLPRFKAFLCTSPPSPPDVSNSLALPRSLPPSHLPALPLLPSDPSSTISATPPGYLRWLIGLQSPLKPSSPLLRCNSTAALSLPRTDFTVLVIDSTYHGQQGKNTQNTIKPPATRRNAPPNPTASRRSHNRQSGHCFVFAPLASLPAASAFLIGSLILPSLYCQPFGLKHLSQASLAAQLIDNLPLPQGSRVLVVGDTAFEAKQLRQACARRSW